MKMSALKSFPQSRLRVSRLLRPRFRKVLADLWSNRVRSLLVVASITVGLFATGVIATLHNVMLHDMSAGYTGVNPANIRISAQLYDDDLARSLADTPGVRQVVSARLFSSRIEVAPGEWVAIDLQAHRDDADRQMAKLTLVEGRWPPQKGEVVIEQYKLADTRAKLGDELTIELPDGDRRKLRLVGVVSDQTVGAFSGGPGFFLAPVQGYIHRDTVKYLQQSMPDWDNTLLITADGDADDETYLRAVAEQAKIDFEDAGGQAYSIAVRGGSDHPNRRYLEAIASVLVFLGGLVLFLSGFLITNTLQAIIQQQGQQIGILKSLGAGRRQVMVLYMALILLFGIAAALLATPLAYQVAFSRIGPLSKIINVAFQGPRWVPSVIVLQVALALLVPQLAALFPIWHGARISVAEALSGLRQSSSTERGTARSVTRAQTPVTTKHSPAARRRLRISRPMLISIRNTFRRKGRLALTLITLSLGGAIFIATFNVQAAMDRQVDLISGYFLADVNLTLEQPQRTSKIYDALQGLPGMAHIEGWGGARTEMALADGSSGESVSLFAPPSNTKLVDPVVIGGRWLAPGDRNAITLNERFQLDYPEYKVGDTLTLKVNGKDSNWTVVGFFQMAGRSSGLLAYTNFESLSAVIGQPDQASSYRIEADHPNLTEAEQEALGSAIEARLKERGVNVADITTGSYVANSAAQGFETLTGFLLFLASLTALVGSIGLAGTMSLNILERTREFGVLRAIGATDRALVKLVLVEGLLIGGISWVIAAALAFPISKLLSDAISLALFGYASTLTVKPTGFLIWLGAVLILSTLACLLPARNAARLTIREVLAYE